MAKQETQNLVFKIVIEGKEEVVSVNLLKKEIDALGLGALKASDSTDKLAAEALKLGQASITNAASIEKLISAEGLNEAAINRVINTLREQQNMYAIGSDQYVKHQAAVANITAAHQNLVAKGLNPTTNQSNHARMAVQQFGFALGDASMFAVDFRMGIMGISNNLPFIIDNLSKVKEQAAVTGTTVGQFIKGQLTGSTGLVLGANLASVALMTLPKIFESINSSSKKAAEEGLKKFTEELKNMTSDQIIENLGEVNDKLKDIYKERKKMADLSNQPSQGVSPLFNWLAAGDYFSTPTDQNKEKKGQLSDAQKEVVEEASKLRGNLDLQSKDIDKLLHQLPSSGGLSEQFKKDINKYVGTVTGVADANRKLVDAKASIDQKLSNLNKSTTEIEKEQLKNAEDLKQKEEERYERLVNELNLRVQLALLNGGDKYQAIRDAIEILNQQLGKQNISLEREVAIRTQIKSLYDQMIEMSDKELTENAAKKKRTEDYLKDVTEKKKEAAEKEDKLQKEFAELRINSIADEHQRELADLEYWKQEELKKWKGNAEAISNIEKTYSNKRNDILRDEYQEKNKTTMSFVNASMDAFGTMWDELIIGGRQAKDPWDAIWLSFRNSALQNLLEILKSDIFNEAVSSASGTKGKSDSGSFFGDALGTLGSILTTIIPFLKPVSTVGVGHALVSADGAISKAVVDRIEKWQTDFTVHNDLFHLNKELKKVSHYVDKYSF